ncbi:MAG: DNA alkylation repair protein, partial [Bacteroidota bacterium]
MKYPLEILLNRYKAKRNFEDAKSMQAYMKGKFSYLGIRSPERRAMNRSFFKEYGKPGKEELNRIVHLLYDSEFREYHYLAMDIAAFFKKKWDFEDIDIIEFMMLNHSWWDTIDFIASHLIGSYLIKFPERTLELNNEYIAHDSFWVRRVAILFQLKFKDKLNSNLMKSNILKCAHEREFFIEKAIGWILREYSKTQPDWVRKF